FILGRNAISLWEPMVAGTAACFLGGTWSFWLGRRLGYRGLKKIRWLHITPARVQWVEGFFKRHGPKAVIIARFIALLPPVVANLMAGMAKMRWGIFLFYNITGSALYVTSYILIGYFFGKKWKILMAWLGPAVLYWMFAGLILGVLGFLFRRPIYGFFKRFFAPKRKGK